MKWYENAFIILANLALVLYVIIFLGIWDKAYNYVMILNWWREVFISFLLMYLFNPWVKQRKITEMHRKIAFTGGLFLFTSTLFSVIVHYLDVRKR